MDKELARALAPPARICTPFDLPPPRTTGGGGYQNTEIGRVIVLAYPDAYTKLVTRLGGLPTNAAAAAPVAR